MSRWYQELQNEIEKHGEEASPLAREHKKMINDLTQWMIDGSLKLKATRYQFENYDEAIGNVEKGKSDSKHILIFDKSISVVK